MVYANFKNAYHLLLERRLNGAMNFLAFIKQITCRMKSLFSTAGEPARIDPIEAYDLQKRPLRSALWVSRITQIKC